MYLSNSDYENLVDKYANMIYRLSFSYTKSKHDAEDILQDVFIKYLQNKKSFKSEEHEKAWLIRVTINCCKKLWLSAWKNKTTSLEDDILFEDPEISFLHKELYKLPKKYRIVIHLFYYEELSIKEISVLLKKNESTIRTQLTRARRLLKEILEEEDFIV